MSTEVDYRITPSLHPQNVKNIDGYEEGDIAAILAPTMTAFDTAYQAVGSVLEARAVAEKNPAWTEEARLMQVDAFARKKLDRVTRLFDSTRANLVKGIASLEGELAAPLESKGAQSVAAEIRAHIKALPTEKRHKFIQERIDAGDELSVAAALGAPGYLSGLDDNFQQTYTRFWNEKVSPDKAKRLKAMIGAKELIERNAPTVFSAMEKAVGGNSSQAKKVREANAAAEKLFASKDA